MAFTLVELLLVIVIIGLLSAAAITVFVPSFRGQAVDSAAAQIRAALVAARDHAALTRRPAGVRLLPDPAAVSRLASGLLDDTKSLAATQWQLLETPPDYSEGLVSIYPGTTYSTAVTGGLPSLVLEEAPGHWEQTGAGAWAFVGNPPTTWWWTARVGEQVQVLGRSMTVCGPAVEASAEDFVNVGPPGSQSPLLRTYTAPDGMTTVQARPEFLLLVNGLDDDRDGFVDAGWDGIDNDGRNGIDDAGEWETEVWPAILRHEITGETYELHRRPGPQSGESARALPGATVVDLTTWTTTRERSRVMVDPRTGQVDLIVDATGRVGWSLPYGVPTSIGLANAWRHLWVCDRSDIHDPAPTAGQLTQLPLPGQLGHPRILSISPSGRLSISQPAAESVADPSAPFKAPEQGW